MLLLSLDTSGLPGSAALLEDEKVLSQTAWQARASHSAELPAQVQKICREAKVPLNRIDAFAVTVGPGSFTGLRVALSFVKGLALPSLKPVAGVSTLLALASAIEGEPLLCPLLDARHEEVYGALFERSGGKLSFLLEEKAGPPSLFLEEVKVKLKNGGGPAAFFGSGARRYEKEIRQVLKEGARLLDPSKDVIQAASVAHLGKALIEKGEFFRGGVDLKPNYLRASTPELKNAKVSFNPFR